MQKGGDMKAYTPNLPYAVPAELMTPSYEKVKGTNKKIFTKVDDIYISFKTFGGTETQDNGVIAVEDTATVETWYRPDITSASRIRVYGKDYEVLGTPENINMANTYLKVKVKAVKGGARWQKAETG